MYKKVVLLFSISSIEGVFSGMLHFLSNFTSHKLSFYDCGAQRMLIVPDETLKDDAGSCCNQYHASLIKIVLSPSILHNQSPALPFIALPCLALSPLLGC